MSTIDAVTIKLPGGMEVYLDAADYGVVSEFKWAVHKGYRMYYAQSNMYGKPPVLMHRLIMNPGPGILVDHIDCNGLNNRRSNLRLCTKQDNCRHARKHMLGASGFKGVTRISTKNVIWAATITINHKHIHLGTFRDQRDAAVVYDQAARQHFGEFALTNEMLGLLERQPR